MYIHVQYMSQCFLSWYFTQRYGPMLAVPVCRWWEIGNSQDPEESVFGSWASGERRLFEEFLYSCMSHRNQTVKFIQCFRLALWWVFLRIQSF